MYLQKSTKLQRFIKINKEFSNFYYINTNESKT